MWKGGQLKFSIPNSIIELKLLDDKYHEKSKDWRIGQAWIVKREDVICLNVVFSKNAEIKECEDVISVDLNGSNITIGTNG